MWIGVFSCHGYILRSGISRLYVNSVFNSFEELRKSFPLLTSPFTFMQCIRVPTIYENSIVSTFSPILVIVLDFSSVSILVPTRCEAGPFLMPINSAVTGFFYFCLPIAILSMIQNFS